MSTPKGSYKDVVPDYDEYLRIQKEGALYGSGGKTDVVEEHERYVSYFGKAVHRQAIILDFACNDGGALRSFKKRRYSWVQGAELLAENVEVARKVGYPVRQMDMHDTSVFQAETFDAVYTTHTLEHMYYPAVVTENIHRILKPCGILFVVLPYPDGGSPGHGGSLELGTCQAKGMAHSIPYDEGAAVTEFFTSRGFDLLEKRFDDFREPEIWLLLRKKKDA